jgi:hypothetical protein
VGRPAVCQHLKVLDAAAVVIDHSRAARLDVFTCAADVDTPN